MLSYGLRYEAQTLLADELNFSPRVTMTWSPLKSGKTTFRAGYGRFTDWFGLGTYEQTQRLDGAHQQEVNIIDPDYPNPGTGGTTPPTNRYLLDPGLALPESQLANVGVDQMIGSAAERHVRDAARDAAAARAQPQRARQRRAARSVIHERHRRDRRRRAARLTVTFTGRTSI